MGLLSDPKTREKAISIISKYSNILCLLCYIGGLLYFLSLTYRPMNAGTYFSENALLPGLVTSNFHSDHGSSKFLQGIRDEYTKIVEEISKDKSIDPSVKYQIPADWLKGQFESLGLDTYVQNYSFIYPAAILKNQAFFGQNVYGILRAPKAASTEALVITAPYRPPGTGYDKTAVGIALMMGLAKNFRKYTYWAKDVIFLVTEHEAIGMQAWLDAYHYSSQEYITAGELHGRSGSIQAALNLEIATEGISKFNVKMEGLNGQMSNLDFINTARKLCMREGIPMSIQKRSDYYDPMSMDGWLYNLKTMLLMMWNQASGTPTGNHGLFHKYRIEAITMQGIKLKNAKRSYGFVEMGKVMEGIMRSLNNLLERFHQSFFFYLLPSTDRYVSIGLYMPPIGIMLLPLVIKALELYIFVSAKDASSEENSKQSKPEKTTAETKEEEPMETDDKENGEERSDNEEDGDANKDEDTGEVEKKEDDEPKELPKATLLSLLPNCLMALMFGLGTNASAGYFVETATAFHMKPQEGILLGAVAITFAGLMYPRMLRKKAVEKGELSGPNWMFMKCVALLSLATVLGAVSVLNISLAFLISAVAVPIVLIVRPTKRRLGYMAQYLLLILISPLGMLLIASIVHVLYIDRITDMAVVPEKVWNGAQNGLLMAVVDGSFHGNWIFSLVSLTLFPIWLLFWALLWTIPGN